MSAAREEILSRIRTALRDVPASERAEDVSVAREYGRHTDRSDQDLVEELTDRVGDYRASVRQVPESDLAGAIAEICTERGLHRLAIPPALPLDWRPAGVELIEDTGLDAHALDALDGAITGCATAIAQTGTIVLDGHGACGRRAITLVPDHHICVVRAEQIVGIVPEGIARVAPGVIDQRLPITLISGPSATSDIELIRVEGVHGPRNLVVLIATP
jgi:L-lactate dehydrogenase complex protein LldG